MFLRTAAPAVSRLRERWAPGAAPTLIKGPDSGESRPLGAQPIESQNREGGPTGGGVNGILKPFGSRGDQSEW